MRVCRPNTGVHLSAALRLQVTPRVGQREFRMTRLGRFRGRVALLFIVLLFPWAAWAAECQAPATWSDHMRLWCHISTHVLVGTVRGHTPSSPEAPVPCFSLEPSRMFRGTAQLSEPFSFCILPSAGVPVARDPDAEPETGETWLVFGSNRMPPLPAGMQVPDGAAVALLAVRVDVDSVRADGLSPTSSSALIDSVEAIMSRCALTKADSVRAGWQ